jgi:hypothetical protein
MRVASLLVILAAAFAGVSTTRAGQSTDLQAVYTPEQAEAGRLALRRIRSAHARLPYGVFGYLRTGYGVQRTSSSASVHLFPATGN